MGMFIKVYVAVFLRVSEAGKISPLAVEWEDGRRYAVRRVADVRMAPPSHVGGGLTRRYRVIVGEREKFLYFETDTGRWFVEKQVM